MKYELSLVLTGAAIGLAVASFVALLAGEHYCFEWCMRLAAASGIIGGTVSNLRTRKPAQSSEL